MAKPLQRLSSPTAQLSAQQFAKRLHALMLQKEISQSDLARKVWGTKTDTRGYEVARNRDRISVYLRGEVLPDQTNLMKIAEVLGVPPEELCADVMQTSAERENPEVQMTVVPSAGTIDGDPVVFLRINKLVPMSVAADLISRLSAHNKKSG